MTLTTSTRLLGLGVQYVLKPQLGLVANLEYAAGGERQRCRDLQNGLRVVTRPRKSTGDFGRYTRAAVQRSLGAARSGRSQVVYSVINSRMKR